MKGKVFAGVLAIVIPVSLLTYGVVQACSFGVGSPKDELAKADAVFIGKLISHTEVRREHNADRGTCTFYTYNFQVSRAWKGVVTTTSNINAFYDCEQRSLCDQYFEDRFKEGQEYLVYAYSDKDEGVLYAYLGPGGASKPLADASGDIQQLTSIQVAEGQIGMPVAGVANIAWLPMLMLAAGLGIVAGSLLRYYFRCNTAEGISEEQV